MVGMTGHDGHTVWMTTDGRVWRGHVPLDGDRFDATFSGHMYEGDHFPDGTNHGTAHIQFEHHSTSMASGSYSGSGDAGTFSMSMSSMWNRSSALETVAGVYTRSTATGYTMTMTIGAMAVSGSDPGLVFSGTVAVPDPALTWRHRRRRIVGGTPTATIAAWARCRRRRDGLDVGDIRSNMAITARGSMMSGSPMMGDTIRCLRSAQPVHVLAQNDHAAIMDWLDSGVPEPRRGASRDLALPTDEAGRIAIGRERWPASAFAACCAVRSFRLGGKSLRRLMSAFVDSLYCACLFAAKDYRIARRSCSQRRAAKHTPS
jgi:hypothetical protein